MLSKIVGCEVVDGRGPVNVTLSVDDLLVKGLLVHFVPRDL